MILISLILRGRKFPQVSRTLLSIPANLINAVILKVSTRPLISVFQYLYQSFLGCSKDTYYYWYHRYFYKELYSSNDNDK